MNISCSYFPFTNILRRVLVTASLLCLGFSTANASEPTKILLNTPNTAEQYSGWVLLADGTKQWISSECRAQLRNAGLTESATDWNEIGGYANTDDWRNCSVLEQAYVGGGNGSGTDTGSGSGTAAVTLLLNGTAGVDGWILYEGGTTQWVSESCRAQLQSASINEVVTDWPTISSYSPGTWLPCDSIQALIDGDSSGPGDGNPPTPNSDTVELLLNGGALDGWVIVNDDSRVWVSSSCRARLEASGIESETVGWSDIAAYPTGPWRSCDDIDALIGSAGPGDGPDPDPDPSGDGVELLINGNAVDGWARFADDTRQWVSESCRAQLVLAGIPVSSTNWTTISGYDLSDTWRSCDAIEALIGDGTTNPGPSGVTINGQFVESSISQTEADALMATYDALGGPNWSQSTAYASYGQTWGTATDPCTWERVTCDNGTVTFIEIAHDRLSGDLPAALFDLSNLENLIILSKADVPTVTGPVPDEIGNLQKLKRLVLQDLGLTGPLPYQVYTLSELTTLYLNGNALSQSVPPAITNLQNLEILNFSDNELGGEILPLLAGIPTLRTVFLSNNQFSGPIPATIGNLTELDTLVADRNFFTGTIPDAIGDVPRVILNLSFNNLSGELPPTLGIQPQLTSVELRDNNLTGQIPDALWFASSLQLLDLGYNDLQGTIPPTIGNLIALGELDLRANQLSGLIPSEIADTPASVVILSSNSFSGSIPASLGAMSQLRRLVLSDNQLTGPIPDSLGNGAAGSTLEVLSLFANQLSGPIPVSLSALSELNTLLLHKNQLEGDIPSEFSALTSLTRMDLSNNQLTGIIPGALSQLPDLRTLNLNNNFFFGELPASFGQLGSLSRFDVRRNQLTGDLTAAFAGFGNLLNGTSLIGLSDGVGYGPNGVGNNCFTVSDPLVEELLTLNDPDWNECD